MTFDWLPSFAALGHVQPSSPPPAARGTTARYVVPRAISGPMIGRRVSTFAGIERPGDYFGPHVGMTGETDDGWHGYLDEGHVWRQV